jgi:hypothetical protein
MRQPKTRGTSYVSPDFDFRIYELVPVFLRMIVFNAGMDHQSLNAWQ